MLKSEAIKNILDYFNENETEFDECIEELDSYNGYLGDDRYYFMEELDEIYHEVDPTELLRRAFYGYDSETWNTDSHGNEEYGAFNPNRQYFTFNGYGNLVSADYKDYSAYMNSYAVEEMAQHRQYISSIEEHIELSILFDEYEDADDKDVA